jgi:hypothetical protein
MKSVWTTFNDSIHNPNNNNNNNDKNADCKHPDFFWDYNLKALRCVMPGIPHENPKFLQLYNPETLKSRICEILKP